MLSRIIKTIILNEASLKLQDKVSLFAENAKGDQYVLVIEGTTSSPQEPIESLRQSDMQVLVVGWPMLDAKFKAEKIYELIGGIAGVYTTTIGNGITETYTIKSVRRRPPIRLSWKGKSDFSINLTLHYAYSNA